jgi:hypothetical protein
MRGGRFVPSRETFPPTVLAIKNFSGNGIDSALSAASVGLKRIYKPCSAWPFVPRWAPVDGLAVANRMSSGHPADKKFRAVLLSGFSEFS